MLIKDLRGKLIGYPFGSNAHYALLQTLSAAGLRETDVHLVRLNVNNYQVQDMPMPAKYAREKSSIRLRGYIPKVSFFLFTRFLWRLKVNH